MSRALQRLSRGDKAVKVIDGGKKSELDIRTQTTRVVGCLKGKVRARKDEIEQGDKEQ